MIKLMFYAVPARDRQRQRSYKIVTLIPYRWREANWHAYRIPKARHRWQHWAKDIMPELTDDLVREARTRRSCKRT